MAGLPENKKFSEMTNAAYSLGNSLPKKAAVQPKYENLSNIQKNSGPVYDKFKDLGTMTVPYGGSTRYENVHPGVDIANKIGTDINSFSGGTVTDMRTGMGRTTKPSFGNYVIVTDPQGAKHRYSHLNQSWVKVGQEVQAGDRLGAMGNSGSVYSNSGGDGSHLDYRIRDAFNKYIDPSKYLTTL